jgi:quercetin dioxygenase-like cupin family protein
MTEMHQKIDPLLSASNVYTLVNENDQMRVLHTTFQIGATAKMHDHPAHMAYVLKGGKLKLTSEGKTQEMTLKEGQAVFLDAQQHEATNTGDSVVELLVVELKKPR